MNKQLQLKNTSYFARSKQQNFQGEVLSGYVISLIKQTQENIRWGRQSRFHCSTLCGYQGELLPINLIKNKKQRESYDNLRQSENIISKS